MTVTTDLPQTRQEIDLKQGELACIPVPEGRVTLEAQTMASRLAQYVVVLHPHGDKPSHELARFSTGGAIDMAQMVLIALAALEAWR